MKKALITGITGQDASYLAELLLEKGYQVYGMHRRCSVDNYFAKVKHLIGKEGFNLVSGDLQDEYSLRKLMEKIKPDEVYNLAAQSHVAVSFDQPIVTRDINYFGLLRLSKALFDVNPKAKLYQASTSELYGDTTVTPQSEKTPLNPVSPYAKAKLESHEHIAKLRDKGFFACAGILFNHESERRGENFVTRKITISASKIKKGMQEFMELGNLNSKRDWGHSMDYVKAMWLMLQQEKPKDYVIGSGETRTVRDFVNAAFNYLGMSLTWEGSGLEEVGKDANGVVRVKVNPKFFRPNEVTLLLSDPTKAKTELGWKLEVSFDELVKRMVDSDMKALE